MEIHFRVIALSTLLGLHASAVEAGNPGIRRHVFPPAKDLVRAEFFVVNPPPRPQAILILCPGCNGSGEDLVRQAEWQEFARDRDLALVGISFASDVSLLQAGRGYYYASQGSGALLSEAMRKLFGRDLPLLMYGFSGGAHFTSRFAEWKPERMVSWCAYSAAWWDQPKARSAAAPGIIACGTEDPARYGPSFIYFKQGRAAGNPWTWVSLPGVGHVNSPALDEFVRTYFDAVLAMRESNRNFRREGGVWRDVDTKSELTPEKAGLQPALSAFFPNFLLAKRWEILHQP